MTEAPRARREQRILVLAPIGKDAALARSVLARIGVDCEAFADMDEVCAALDDGAGALLLVEEAVVGDRGKQLVQWQTRQPPWSDLPILVLSRPGADSAAVAEAMDLLGNVTVLERPTRVAALVSAVRTALRARARQYQTRDHIEALESAKAALRESDRRKDEFLAILSHELRNPLAPIRNSLHVLRNTGPRDPALGRVVAMMERQVNAMVRLVDDLLEASRITRGMIALRIETVDVASVVRSAVETSRPLLESAGHRLFLSLPEEPLVVEGDPVRLTQVFSNLLNNAAKYTDPGGQIRVRARRVGDEVHVSVQDSGIGIPAEELTRVFELFVQGGQHEARADGGLGIGLTLVKHLVEMHGGRVEAASEGKGRGSEFVVRLNVGPRPAPATRSALPAGSSAALAGRSVLVVDDNHDAAESLALVLGLLGADVRVAFNGPDALAEIQARKPSIVLLDIGMSGMDGHEVARRIRRAHGPRELTLIALTGWGREEDRRKSQAAGFDYHLTKPADVEVLQRLLASLDASGSQGALARPG